VALFPDKYGIFQVDIGKIIPASTSFLAASLLVSSINLLKVLNAVQ
jgi:hypothetical protein